jgi:predicted membrane GTPase involved in stress response
VQEVSKISRIVKKYGMSEIEIPVAYAGDIVSIAGF